MPSITLERDVEELIGQELTNLGWVGDPRSKDRNVYLQKPKTTDQRRKLGSLRPDYTLYKSGSDEPIAVIEAKKPGQRIHEALNQGARYAEHLGAPIVFATDGVFTKTLHVNARSPLFLNGEEVDELLREAVALRFLATNEVTTLDKKVVRSRSELISIFESVNKLLREEGLQKGLERFTEFANILFLKVLSEVEDAKEELGYTSEVPREFRWDYFKEKRGRELLAYVSDTVLGWFANAYHDENIFQPLQISHPDNLRDIIAKLDDLQLTDINADIKGDAFEYFVRAYSASNPSDLGEIFTPRHVVKTAVKLLNPQIGEKVYDPFCGTGGMLTVAFKHILDTMPRNERNLRLLREATIYGADLTKTASIAKMNMILAGDGHNNIVRHDSLKNPVDDLYDVVLTNMPFAQSTRYGDLYPVPSRNADVVCPQHCLRAIKPGGRMAIIVPEGFLSKATPRAFQDVRHLLLDSGVLRSVVSLPRGAFEPYNRAKADILYFTDVKETKSKGHYWYFEVKNDGFTPDKRRRRVEGPSDFDIVLSERSDLDSLPPDYLDSIGAVRIGFEEVRANKYALNAAHYREPAGLSSHYETVAFGELFERSASGKIGDDQEVPILSMTMQNGLVAQDKKFHKRIASADISNYHKVKYGELVVGFPIDEGVLGFQLMHPVAAVSPAYEVWSLKRNDIDPRYLELVLRSREMREVYKVKVQSPVDRRRKIDTDVLLRIQIPLPPVEVRERLVQARELVIRADDAKAFSEQRLSSVLSRLWIGRDRPGANVPEEVAKRFADTAALWKQETAHLSSISDVVLNRNYQRIIGMGIQVVPLILKEMARKPDHWFWALYSILGVNPVPKQDEGNVAAMTDAWLAWGHEEGYLG